MVLFVITGATLIGTLLLARYIVTSRLGRVLTAIRDAEARVMFCGYNTLHYKLFIWTLSAVLCGIAGALYVPQVGIINPSEMSPANSIEIAIWVAVGGRGTLVGPIIGAGLVNGAKSLFTQVDAGILALRARAALHPRHAVPAAGRGRPLQQVEETRHEQPRHAGRAPRRVGRRHVRPAGNGRARRLARRRPLSRGHHR